MPWETRHPHCCGLKARDAGDAVLAGSNTPSRPSPSLNTHFVTGKVARTRLDKKLSRPFKPHRVVSPPAQGIAAPGAHTLNVAPPGTRCAPVAELVTPKTE